jgi:hypothetical protein
MIDKAIQRKLSSKVSTMTPLKPATFRLEEEILEGLQDVKERDGLPVTEQVRRALTAWLESRGVKLKKSDRKRAGTRKRP